MFIGTLTSSLLTTLPPWLPEASHTYTIRSFARLMLGFPELLRGLRDPIPQWTVEDLRPARPRISGGEFLLMPERTGRFVELDSYPLPVPRTYRLTRRSDNLLRCEVVETGKASQLACAPFTPAPGGEGLDVQWTPDLPFEGPLRLHQAWSAQAAVEIQTEPTRYPWHLVARLAASNNDALMTLSQAELMDEFQSAHDPKEKCALLVVALARMHPLFT